MKNLLIISLLLLITSYGFGQIDKKDYFNKTTGFVPKTIESPTFFYNSPNGRLIDSISQQENGWIHFVIDKQKGEWVNLKTVSVAPGVQEFKHLTGSWIKISNVYFNLVNDSSYCFEKPNEKSNHQVITGQNIANLTEIKGNWAKAIIKVDDKEIEGWIKKQDQCGMPWTTCNY